MLLATQKCVSYHMQCGYNLVYCQGVDYRLKLKGKTSWLKEMLIFTI